MISHRVWSVSLYRYLYSHGYGIPDILFYFATFYAFGAFGLNGVVGRLIARFGPKHIIGTSFFLQMAFFVLLASLPEYGWPLWLLAFIARLAGSCFYLAFHVIFSKIKHSERGGQELGFMSIVSRIASFVGPIVGGVVATAFGAQSIFIVAAPIFELAIIPLVISREPIKNQQKFTYRGMPIRKIRRALAVSAFSNLENSLTSWLWPLYVSIFIFANKPYLKLGIVSSIGTAVSITVAFAAGRLIDNKKAHELLSLSVIMNSAVHLLRLLAVGLKSIILINIVGESITTSYRMTFTKGYYDSADDVTDYRIAYIVLTETMTSGLRSVVWAGLGVAALYWPNDQKTVVASGFVLAAIVSLLVLFQKFPALQKQT